MIHAELRMDLSVLRVGSSIRTRNPLLVFQTTSHKVGKGCNPCITAGRSVPFSDNTRASQSSFHGFVWRMKKRSRTIVEGNYAASYADNLPQCQYQRIRRFKANAFTSTLIQHRSSVRVRKRKMAAASWGTKASDMASLGMQECIPSGAQCNSDRRR